MITEKLEITIGGKDEDIDASAFVTVVSESIKLLKEIDAQFHGGHHSVEWVLSAASKNSPLNVEFNGRPVRSTTYDAAIAEKYLSAMDDLENGRVPPPYMTLAMIKRARRIGGTIGTKLSQVVFSDAGGRLVSISNRLAANVDMSQLPDKYTEFGEIEGELGQVTAHGDNFGFCIFDPITDSPVTCEFDESELPRVLKTMRRRVRVSGLVTYRRQGDVPVSVKVDDWDDLLGQSASAPAIEEVHALQLDLTRGRPSEEVIKALRVFHA